MHPVQYEPGQILAGTVYRVIRHLATGGMGSVYDVEDTTVEKRYVLKTLHPQLVSREDLARRMRDEAKSLAKLQHPNIVDVITAGVTKDAVKMPFYVMERLIGQNLRVVLAKKSALDLTHCYRIAIDVADALEHAHENNIVHRDVKPENIFLHRNANGTTTTKLLDFGIVRLLDRKASHTHGKFIGTIRYASPEQISGREISPSTDIYSLGLVLFEMLCGRGPFDDAGDQYAVGAAHASQPPPALSRFVRVAPDVERLVISALAKDPAQRPRDCFSFASELRRILRDEEASPRWATAVNVLSAGAPATRREASGFDTGPTVQGMIPPSGAPSTDPPATTRDERNGPVSPVAPTVAAAWVPALSRHEDAGAKQHPPVQVIAAGHAPRVIDRSAPTRASEPSGVTQRLAQNDTRMDAGAAVPFAPAGDLVFSPMQASNATGPLAGEAPTRPPERGPIVLVVVAAMLAMAMIGAALIVVVKPWRSARPPAMAASTGTIASAPPDIASPIPIAPAVASTPAIAEPSPVPLPSASVSAGRGAATGTVKAPVAAGVKPPAPAPSGYSPAVKFE